MSKRKPARRELLVDELHEANRHIEAMALVRKDNSWDMLNAMQARNKIVNEMLSTKKEANQ